MKILKYTFASVLALIFISLLLFGYEDRTVEELKEKYGKSPSQFLSMDGMEVHFRDEGVQSDTLPIVLIHGTGSSLHTFDGWTETLKQKRRVIRMDIPAFGLTGPFPDRDYSIEHYVAFLDNFLNEIGVHKFILGGNSLGGQIAWNYTLKNRDKVEKLILIDAAGYPLNSKSIPIAFKLARTPILNKVLTVLTPKFMAKTSVENVYSDKSLVTEELVDRYFLLTLRTGNRQALADRMTGDEDLNTITEIKTINQPTLILWGEDDLLIPLANAERFHKELPNDTLVILKNSGHVPMEESPEKSLVTVLEFIGF
jgi:pimeloyl-ACP methyl ester carboxylesterase